MRLRIVEDSSWVGVDLPFEALEPFPIALVQILQSEGMTFLHSMGWTLGFYSVVVVIQFLLQRNNKQANLVCSLLLRN